MPPARNPFYMTPAHDLIPWRLHVAFVQLNSIRRVELLEHLFTVLLKAQLF